MSRCEKHRITFHGLLCPGCIEFYSQPAQPLAADTSADALPAYLGRPFDRGDVLRLLGFIAAELPEPNRISVPWLLECLKRFESSLPACDTSPSRTSNAASANGAASLLLKLRERLQDFPTEAYGGMGAQELIRDFRDDVLCLIDSMLIEPLSEPAIHAAVYGCTDAQCVCGRCAPVRLAIDPWQGLGKTWSER